MNEQPILDRIERLVDEEHRLWRASEQGGLTDSEHKRLHAVRTELDRCWNVLRLRRAGADLMNTLWADRHGVHDDQPAPDPDVPRDVP